MEENILELLKQYEMEVLSVTKGRGVYLCKCKNAYKSLSECRLSEERIKLQYEVTKSISNDSGLKLDLINLTVDNKEYAIGKDGKRYILKDYFNAKECNITQEKDALLAISALALLHNELRKCEPNDCEFAQNELELNKRYEKKYKELKTIKNYLHQKRNKSDFEICAQHNYQMFLAQADESMKLLEDLGVSMVEKHLCHGSYNYHNIMFNNDETIITNFEKMKFDIQILDLYDFMRKVLEKHNWELSLADKMLNAYQKSRTIEKAEFEVLRLAFTFPEKFWKVVNFYYNNSKVWIPQKNMEKLKICIDREENRKMFIDSIFA